MIEPRQIAVVHDYDGLHAALRARADELRISRESIDANAGFQDGYTGKLLAPVPIKGIGQVTLGPLLTVLGLKIVLIEDADALTRYAKRAKKRRHPSGSIPAKKRAKRQAFRGDSDWGRVMRARQILMQSPGERSQQAKRMNRMRWRAERERRVATRNAPGPG